MAATPKQNNALLNSLMSDFQSGVSNFRNQEANYQNKLMQKLQSEQNRGLLGNILQSITSPIRTIGEGIRSYGALASGQPITRDFNLDSVLDTEELKKAVEKPEQVLLQETAKAGSFLLPGVHGVGSIPGAVGAGALQGFGETEDITDVGQTVQDVVGGAAIGGATQGVLDKALPFLAKGAKGTLQKVSGKLDDIAGGREVAAISKAVGGNPSKKLGGSVLIEDIARIANQPEFKTVINNTDDLLGFADNIYKNAGGIIDSQVSGLTESGTRVSTQKLTAPLKEQLTKIKTPQLQKPLQQVIDVIEQQGDSISPSDLLQLRREFGKLGKFNPTVSTADQQIASAFEKAYGSVSDELRSVLKSAGFDNYDQINKLLETATKAEQWVRQKSGKAAGGSINDLVQDSAIFGFVASGGNPLGAGGGVMANKLINSPAGERTLGKVLGGVSKVLKGGDGISLPQLPEGIKQEIAPVLSNLSFLSGGAGDAVQPLVQSLPFTAGSDGQTLPGSDATGASSPFRQQLRELMQAGFDFDQALEIIDRESASTGGGRSLPAGQVESLSGIQSSIQGLDDLEQTIENNSNRFGIIQGGALGDIAQGLGLDDERAGIRTQINTLAQTIGKALEGGKLTDQDIERYRTMLPQLNDTPGVALEKLRRVRQMVQQNLDTQIQGFQQAGYNPYSASNEPSFQDALMMLQ